MTINKHRGEVGIKAGDTEIVLRPTMAAIIAWEESSGRSTLALAVEGAERSLRIKDVCAIITASADAAGNPITPETMTEIIEKQGLAYLLGPAIALVSHALTGGTEAEPGEAEATAGNP